MAGGNDKFEAVLETQDDATKQKLFGLQEKIEAHISSSPFDKLGNNIMGENNGEKQALSYKELIGAIYAKRMSKDVIMTHIAGEKNEKLSLFGKLSQKIGDQFTDSILKQKNSYDAVLAQMQEVVVNQFRAELDELKNSILISKNANEKEPDKDTEQSLASNEWYAENSHYTEEEKKQIEEIIKNAQDYTGVPYKLGGTTKSNIDCSGLWSKALDKEYQESNSKFGRLTAALFDDKSPNTKREEVERGDRMFREDPEWVKGHSNEKGEKIYHIEMALWKPFEKDGKWYVKTYGSSSDTNTLDANGVNLHKNGVGYRLREVKTNHHFAKPPYYTKLVTLNGNKQKEAKTA